MHALLRHTMHLYRERRAAYRAVSTDVATAQFSNVSAPAYSDTLRMASNSVREMMKKMYSTLMKRTKKNWKKKCPVLKYIPYRDHRHQDQSPSR